MTKQEREARVYCLFIGSNPDAPVAGYVPTPFGRQRIVKPRWQWYVGAMCNAPSPAHR